MHFIVAALGLFLIRANSPKDFPLFSCDASINKGISKGSLLADFLIKLLRLSLSLSLKFLFYLLGTASSKLLFVF
jgi:hypothetical protein